MDNATPVPTPETLDTARAEGAYNLGLAAGQLLKIRAQLESITGILEVVDEAAEKTLADTIQQAGAVLNRMTWLHEKTKADYDAATAAVTSAPAGALTPAAYSQEAAVMWPLRSILPGHFSDPALAVLIDGLKGTHATMAHGVAKNRITGVRCMDIAHAQMVRATTFTVPSLGPEHHLSTESAVLLTDSAFRKNATAMGVQQALELTWVGDMSAASLQLLSNGLMENQHYWYDGQSVAPLTVNASPKATTIILMFGQPADGSTGTMVYAIGVELKGATPLPLLHQLSLIDKVTGGKLDPRHGDALVYAELLQTVGWGYDIRVSTRMTMLGRNPSIAPAPRATASTPTGVNQQPSNTSMLAGASTLASHVRLRQQYQQQEYQASREQQALRVLTNQMAAPSPGLSGKELLLKNLTEMKGDLYREKIEQDLAEQKKNGGSASPFGPLSRWEDGANGEPTAAASGISSEKPSMPTTPTESAGDPIAGNAVTTGRSVSTNSSPTGALVRDKVTRNQAEREAMEGKARMVFAYWQEIMGKQRALYDPTRQTRILTRLRENKGDVGELLYAIDGAERDDFIMGRDHRSNKKYNGIETIFRDRAQVEKLAETQRGYQAGRVHPVITSLEQGNG